MAARNFFRLNDVVTVRGSPFLNGGEPCKGRVICVNRESRYDEHIVVLASAGGSEHILTFKPDGNRYIGGSSYSITLGWKSE